MPKKSKAVARNRKDREQDNKIAKISRAMKEEVKQFSVSTGSAAFPVVLTQLDFSHLIVQGTTQVTRLGSKIHLVGYEVYGLFNNTDTAANHVFRLIIGRIKGNSYSYTATPGDVLTPNNVLGSLAQNESVSQPKWLGGRPNENSLNVLKDYGPHWLTAANTATQTDKSVHMIHFRKRLNVGINYVSNTGTAADISDNQMALWHFATNAACIYNYTISLYYTDA